MLVDPISVSSNSSDPSISTAKAVLGQAPQEDKKSKEAQKPPLEVPQIQAAARDMQANLNIIHNVNLQFEVHEKSGQVVITVTDDTTGEVIRRIPSQEVVDLAAKLDDMVGLIFDVKT